ncbi:GINS complex Psf1 component [Mycena maculata]|uniref:DNA replication complex GINS protein PSF1 n=1 Tax=Mycena maculata TaxID=230809 RepID=A0AAD7J2X3_9AGAR|nr:GINS complex Psf1 component [Mycena maculata]KAJ7753390.1 GINS complex Psf1 component [Mycena maculata]
MGSYGELATRLMQESKRSLDLQQLLPHNGPLIRSVIQEQHHIEQDIERAKNAGNWMAIVIMQRVILQNKRCLLAYHSQRTDLIQQIYWSHGCTFGPVMHIISANSSTEEINFLRNYHDSVGKLRSDVFPDDPFDIASSIEHPPANLMVTVDVIQSPGIICMESGTIDFKKGHRYVVRRTEVDHLIMQGYLQEL